jgi:thiol-disulfide isomerase/thioredoxin
MTTYYRRFVLLGLFALLTFPTFAEEVNFIKDNVRVAIDRAAAEGKLVFLDFWADYCSPCQLMEKYTFTDPSVISRMNGSYVPVRINIETFDGYDLKAQYNVKLLPTIIVLNSKGKQVARFEESMSATKLNEVLEKYDTKKNRAKIEKPKENAVNPNFSPDFETVSKPNVNAKPTVKPSDLPTKPVEKPVSAATNPAIATRPTTRDNASVAANNSANNAVKPTYKPPVIYGSTAPTNPTKNAPTIKPTRVVDAPKEYSNTTVRKPVVVEKPVAVAPREATAPTKGNAKESTERFTKGTFTIQVGNFANKENASRVSGAMKIQMEGKQKVFLLSGGPVNATTHRVMVGGFKTHKEATEFKKQNQIEGFVQNYATFIK